MKPKIRVYGKSQSRTVLGIINAYLKLYPDSTLSDLQQAFPKSLNPKSFTDNIIVPEKETIGQEKQFFEREDELVVLKNGERLALVEVWPKEDYEAISEHAKQYGIEVAKIEESKPFEKGSYDLEYLDDFIPPGEIPPAPEIDVEKKRKFGWWWWLILLLILLLLILFFWKKCCSSECSTTKVAATEIVAPATPTVAATDSIKPDSIKSVADTLANKANNLIKDLGDALSITLPDGKEWKIPKNTPEFKLFSFLNSSDAKVDESDKTKGWITLDRLSFGKGKAVLAPEAESQLKNIAMIMKFFPNSQIKMGGYSDNTGSNELNMKLTDQRAKVAADKLIALGVDAKRVTHEGYGSQFPVCPANDTDACKAANRRVDVRVTQK